MVHLEVKYGVKNKWYCFSLLKYVRLTPKHIDSTAKLSVYVKMTAKCAVEMHSVILSYAIYLSFLSEIKIII